MSDQWLIVADAASAKIFSRDTNSGDLSALTELEHGESRAHDGDLRTGGKGSVQESGSSARHQPDPHTSVGDKHGEIFAKQVVDHLKSAYNSQSFKTLILTADPAFLGRLRDQLDSTLEKTVVGSIDKNWTQESARDIAGYVNDQLDD